MTEQIWANQLRFFEETSPRSGVPSGQVLDPDTGPSAAARRVLNWGSRVDAFRNPQPQTPLHQYHEISQSFTPSAHFLAWFMSRQATTTGFTTKFDRKSTPPTFCLQVETLLGDRFEFRGITPQEIQIACEPRRPVTLDLSLFALERRAMAEPLAEVTGDLNGDMMAAVWGAVSWVPFGWGADIRNDNPLTCFSATLYFTRRDLSPAAFMPDCIPTRYTSVPWRVMAEIRVPDCQLLQLAKGTATGRLAVFIGHEGEDIEFIGQNIRGFSDADPIKSEDFRDETVMIEFHPDAAGSLIEMRDNVTPTI